MAWINEIYDTLYDPDTICVACISHGKDSNAMLRAIKLLGLPLHRIVTSDVWATQDIPADLPPMWEWKKEADQIIKTLYGIEVEHICAMQKEAFPISEQCKAEVEAHANEDLSQFVQVEREQDERRYHRLFYEDMFYRSKASGRWQGNIKGFPCIKGSWCKKLKFEKVDIRRYILSTLQGRKEGRKERVRIRLRDNSQSILPRGAQEYTDSQCRKEIGAQARSNHPYGFPISVRRGQWCQQLKLFLKAPRTRGEK